MPDKTLMNESREEQLRKAIMLLDCALPWFERAAAQEKAAERMSVLKKITHQERYRAVFQMLHEVGPTVGYEP